MAGLVGAAANVGFLLIALLSLGLNSVVAGLGEFFSALLPDAWAQALLANGAWRLLFLLGALPALLTLFIRIYVPESEKWMEASKKVEAKPQVSDIFRGGLARVTIIGALLGTIALLGTWGSVFLHGCFIVDGLCDIISNTHAIRGWNVVLDFSGWRLDRFLLWMVAPVLAGTFSHAPARHRFRICF